MAARGSNVTNVSASATSVTLFASNEGASARHVYNDSSAILRLKYGATASATSFTALLNPGDLYEFPRPIYDGVVDGIWSAAAGAARCTEVLG